MASLLTEDVIISPMEVTDLSGREQIAKVLANFFSTASVERYTFHLAELDVCSSKAYGRGEFDWLVRSPPMRVHGRFFAVFQRGTDGVWRLHRLIENATPPPK